MKSSYCDSFYVFDEPNNIIVSSGAGCTCIWSEFGDDCTDQAWTTQSRRNLTTIPPSNFIPLNTADHNTIKKISRVGIHFLFPIRLADQ